MAQQDGVHCGDISAVASDVGLPDLADRHKHKYFWMHVMSKLSRFVQIGLHNTVCVSKRTTSKYTQIQSILTSARESARVLSLSRNRADSINSSGTARLPSSSELDRFSAVSKTDAVTEDVDRKVLPGLAV